MVVLFSPDLREEAQGHSGVTRPLLAGCLAADWPVPGPMGFEEGGVVDDGGEQGGERQEEQGGEELGHDGVLERNHVENMRITRHYTVGTSNNMITWIS